MSIRNHQGNPTRAPLVVAHSPAESRAAGFAIGRLLVNEGEQVDGLEVIRVIEDSGMDMVVVRAPTANVQLSHALRSPAFTSWLSDTLLYFHVEAAGLALRKASVEVEDVAPRSWRSSDRLIGLIFADYVNHYSASPVLSRVSVVGAYQEWARSKLSDPFSTVYSVRNEEGQEVGLSMVDRSSKAIDEIQLAGIIPQARGRGYYSGLLTRMAQLAAASGKHSLAISTQASNTRVMRAWCRLGFVPVMAFNTFHVVRRELIEVFG